MSNMLMGAIAPLVAIALVASPAIAQSTTHHTAPAISANSVVFGPAPDAFPANTQIAILMGDPSKPGPFVARLKFPAGYVFPPHMHSVDELVTVLTGTLHFGHGEVFDKKKGEALATGGFVPLAAKHAHFVWTEAEAIIQVHGTGPFDVIYVNAADDRRKK